MNSIATTPIRNVYSHTIAYSLFKTRFIQIPLAVPLLTQSTEAGMHMCTVATHLICIVVEINPANLINIYTPFTYRIPSLRNNEILISALLNYNKYLYLLL